MRPGGGQTGGVIQASPGQHSLRLEDLHPTPHTRLGVALRGLHSLTSAGGVQVVVGLPDKVSFQVATFTEDLSLFVAIHRVVTETVLAQLTAETFMVENFALRFHFFSLKNLAVTPRTGLLLLPFNGCCIGATVAHHR